MQITAIVVVKKVSFRNCSAFPNDTMLAPKGSIFISALLNLLEVVFTKSINGLFFAVSLAAKAGVINNKRCLWSLVTIAPLYASKFSSSLILSIFLRAIGTMFKGSRLMYFDN